METNREVLFCVYACIFALHTCIETHGDTQRRIDEAHNHRHSHRGTTTHTCQPGPGPALLAQPHSCATYAPRPHPRSYSRYPASLHARFSFWPHRRSYSRHHTSYHPILHSLHLILDALRFRYPTPYSIPYPLHSTLHSKPYVLIHVTYSVHASPRLKSWHAKRGTRTVRTC